MTRSSIVSEAFLVMALLLASVASSATGFAQQGDAVLAEALFGEGRELMAAGRYSEACPKLAESYRLDPAGGALLNLAICHEKEGKTATAWAELKDALGLAVSDGRPDREELARKHIQALEPRLNRLTIRLAAGADLPGLEISRNGSKLGTAALGTPLPIDPGTHTVIALAPGYRRWQANVRVQGEGESRTVVVPVLKRGAEGSGPSNGGGSSEQPAADEHPGDGSMQRTLGYVIGGVGIAATIVGIAFGVRTINLHNESDDKCGDSGLCPDTEEGREGLAANEDAHTSATLSNVFFGAGLVLVAAGVVVVLTAPSGDTSKPASLLLAPSLSADGAGVQLRATW